MFNSAVLLACSGTTLEKGTHEFSFTASADGSGINLFPDVSAVAHPADAFTVYINGTATDQSFTSLTFLSGDVVKIVGEEVVGFPVIYSDNLRCIGSISKLPRMTVGMTLLKSWGDLYEGGFYRCQQLTSIPADVFENNSAISYLAYTFYGTGLTELPSGVLDHLSKLTNYVRVFGRVNRVPAGFFANNPELTTVQGECVGTQDSEIPSSLFANNPKLKSVNELIAYNDNVTALPSGLFANNVNLETLGSSMGLVSSCDGLITIPEDLLANNVNLKSVGSLFENCSSLSSIPGGLFANNQNLEKVSGVCRGCDSVTTIPENLFANNPNLKVVEVLFQGCSVTSLPPGLFANNPNIETMGSSWAYGAFAELKITSVPQSLFANNPNIKVFGGTFYRCDALTSVPSGLFSNNTAATEFSYVFSYCTSLTTLPENLFEHNVEVTNFDHALYGCTNLSCRLKIGSPNVRLAREFCANAGPVTVVVPAGSTTETTFRDLASTCTNLTVETF